MIEPLAELVAANLSFVGLHFAMSHPLRAPMAQALGERGFQALYSLVRLTTFAWVILAYQDAPSAYLIGPGGGGGIVASREQIGRAEGRGRGGTKEKKKG